MLSKRFIPITSSENFFGVNTKDSDENMLPGEWHEDSYNVYSDPRGAVGSRPGYTTLTTASIGSATSWGGFYEFKVQAGGSVTSHYIGGGSNGKVYKYASNTYTELFSGLSTTLGHNKKYSFFTLDNNCIITTADGLPLVFTGTGSAATFATSITADFGIEWYRYGWLHSTVDPRLMYYSPLGDPDGAYTTFLNFDKDEGEVTGVCKQGDNMLVGKFWSLFKVEYRGTTPLFRIYKLRAKVGPISHWTFKELPDGRAIFLGTDCNFYMVVGDVLTPVGDNIKKYVKAGVRARLKYATSGLLHDRSQYWTSFTRLTGAATNDRTIVMDWSRPYADKWGNTQYPWFIYTIGANCFAEITSSGANYLYHGGYVGKMYRDDNGTNDDGTAMGSSYKSSVSSHNDLTLEKKYDAFNFSFANKGDWDLDISFLIDQNANTQKNIAHNMLGGVGAKSLFGVAKFDEDNFSSESNADVQRDIMRQGKTIQLTMGTDGLDEAWLVYNYTIHAKPMRRATRGRESS